MSNLNKLSTDKYLTYNEFIEQFKKQVNGVDIDSLNEFDIKYFEYRKLNLQRSTRLEKTFEPSVEAKQSFSKLNSKQTWVVITESWCGDSAQNLPVIAKLAELNSLIKLKIVLRDSNPDFMNLYLTNGGRSIPKLIAFDEDENELFQWGPRPKAAQDLFSNLKIDGMEKSEINKELHLWYGRNRGKELEREIVDIMGISIFSFGN